MSVTTLALFALAIAPAVAIILYIYSRDKHDREPVGVLIVSFLAGCFSVVPAIILETILPGIVPGSTGSSLFSVAIYAFIIVAGSEEFCKYLFLRYYAYRKPSFNEPYDGIVYGIMVGMGFATIENIMYVFGASSPGAALGTAGLRALTAVPAHAAFAVIMGYYIGLAKFSHQHETRLMLQGFFGAVLLHGFYDFFLFQNITAGLYAGALVSLVIGLRFSIRAMRMHKQHPHAIKQTSEQFTAETYESPNRPD